MIGCPVALGSLQEPLNGFLKAREVVDPDGDPLLGRVVAVALVVARPDSNVSEQMAVELAEGGANLFARVLGEGVDDARLGGHVATPSASRTT
jgi:hypothetical protein